MLKDTAKKYRTNTRDNVTEFAQSLYRVRHTAYPDNFYIVCYCGLDYMELVLSTI
jgi:hypothetical protein